MGLSAPLPSLASEPDRGVEVAVALEDEVGDGAGGVPGEGGGLEVLEAEEFGGGAAAAAVAIVRVVLDDGLVHGGDELAGGV